ncbi:type II toxin-antitoxin system MqsR family toxin [Stenotrophomonas sepilia]|uniref:type II toxin-antitoxin system MqsR family toxin n=1 Tax=Stenotrophomonas sepilia TaxID=2860290 RepID=UPI0028E0691B|nr:type II toxin-antitoxin system MqsR family toxin [Stenotrophomonas maltophilia]
MSAPLYELDRIHEAARCRRVTMNRTVQRDVTNLGYGFNDVCECLEALTPADYAGRYVASGPDGSEIQFDVYKPCFPHSRGIDALYVKLSERSNATLSQVALGSFHLQRKG